ncbi:glycosyltransferase family 32 protein [Luteirhabdus pelagi]|uniref:glycosyltransferase family 32 protein n=1 Tax=Luteirhabdus pelagi TaxID=2792783 RepID=UPI0019399758|nr:glycosyltransferase [Luteirhabdus pelagi]
MIPKILHYCWFGEGEKPKTFQRCLESWKTHCPDFEIKEWNEETLAPYRNRFAEDALRKERYAFVADAIRVAILKKEGGIYMDTDMLLLQPIDSLLHYDFFTGYEVAGRPAYGMFGAVPAHPIIKQMHAFYEANRFDPFSPPVITHTFKHLVTKEHLGANDIILDYDYLYPLPYQERQDSYESYVTENTLAVHLWDHSWHSPKKETLWRCLQHLNSVAIDYVFYGYPKKYFKRYTKEFSRKAYHRIIGKRT